MSTKNSVRKSQGDGSYTSIPGSSFLVKENKVPAGVHVVPDNEIYGDPYDQFDYAKFAHSKRKLTLHEKKVKSSFVKNDEVQKWIQQSLKTSSIHCRITIK